MNNSIVSDPGILGGKPCIKRTRISVEIILELLASGASRDDILRAYPHLTAEQIMAALSVHGFQVGLHGHVHEAMQGHHHYDDRRQIYILGAGTFGAPAKEQVPGIPLQYQLLSWDRQAGKLTVHTRKKEKPEGSWSADAWWGDKNRPAPEYTLDLRHR